MNDFHPPLSGDSEGRTVPTCNQAKDRGKVGLDIANGSNAETPGYIGLAGIMVQALGQH